ncbi:MAG: putative transport system permease protein [Pseudonocardiales bacterium]|nr:putative transport system permease protein [Pseudonocardiales bacterium]
MKLTWLLGLLRHRGPRLVATAAGVAIAVALLGTLAAFLAASTATMTDRATRAVAVDWQVQVAPGGAPAQVLDAVRAAPGTTAAVPVDFGQTSGLVAVTRATGNPAATTTQNTGPGVVLGLPEDYRSLFPDAIRVLAGSGGVLLAQQTAANLHAAPGDTIQINRSGLAPASVRVDGIVGLPQADSLFQRVGAAPKSQPPAPPDNVLLLPEAQWHQVFDPLAPAHPDQLSTQIHAARSHRLPADPARAYNTVVGAAHNLELRAAGAAMVGDNLAATLDKARGDAAYAQVLFLFLGLPGAVLAGLFTAAVAAAGTGRRRREQALLRARGADAGQLVQLAAVEAAAVGVAGCLAGLGAAALIGWLMFGSARFGSTTANAVAWGAAATSTGLVIAAATILLPAYRELRTATVVAGRVVVGRAEAPRWSRYGLDLWLLAGGGAVFWATSRSGYQLVLAPEGVPGISVSYWAFAGPALLWAGSGLLVWRLVELLLGRGRPIVAAMLAPLAGNLATTSAAMLSRRRRPLARSIVLLGLAVAFAASTATFNATYRQQAEVDAQLTNGADVTVSQPPGSVAGPAAAAQLAAVAGVRAAEPIQHRFGYVGTDLQDLYGINPATITRGTSLPDQYFQGGTAAELLGRLAAAPDAILVSAETVNDFQLRPGDLLNLRLPDARTGQLMPVPFHYAGIVTEFPTAPKDSFLVANAAYLATATGSDAVGAFLVDTGGQDTGAVAGRIQALLGPSATVTDVDTVRGQVGSSLTAVDLAGLTRIELGFALVLAAAGGGLVLALGLAERRRGIAIAVALGARRRHLRRLAASEALVLGTAGLGAGAATGWALAEMLVAVLTGVFDPPPATIAVPWAYLVVVTVSTLGALAVATVIATRPAGQPDIAPSRQA